MPEKEKKAPEQGSLRCRFKRLCSLHYYTRGKHKVNYLYSQCRAIICIHNAEQFLRAPSCTQNGLTAACVPVLRRGPHRMYRRAGY
jgi:hypothetical protein